MGIRRDGLLLLDKPIGPTSHDMVDAVRGLLETRRVGHCGTLDPMASGLLVILAGRATKLEPYIPGDPKVYRGSVLLGIETDSMDMEGNIVSRSSYDGGKDRVEEVFQSLHGELEQVPPMYSAVKYKGKPLYKYARMGETVPRRSRKVRIYDISMEGLRHEAEGMAVDFTVSCSPGTYVRELAYRVGYTLGCGATLRELRRVSSGPYDVRYAMSIDGLSEHVDRDSLELIGMSEAVYGLEKAVVLRDAVRAVSNGAPLSEEMVESVDNCVRKGDTVAVMSPDLQLLGFHTVVRDKPFSSRARRII
ncbi:MAG: tRNA pseudouridine(55) synthase TruB [Actinomycetota bacterium]|nr:tRNA pseudouridine(55) synthase TruB [Actinomycetota bacterium]